MKNINKILVTIFIIISSVQIDAQISWKRSEPVKDLPLQLFHSQHSINLPTAETLEKGNFEFEVSHRFIPSIKDGGKALFGFDGPANIRLALGYAITDNLFVTLGRSNVDDNVDFRAKYNFFKYDGWLLPVVAAVRGGIGWNTEAIGRSSSDSRNFQYYGQLIVNTMIDKKLGIGFVPSYLYNSNIYKTDIKDSFTFGINLQYYITRMFSVIAEFNPTVSGYRNRFDSFSTGIELETGGHFFKIILSNNSSINPSQFLAGADRRFEDGYWRIGFNITRLLQF